MKKHYLMKGIAVLLAAGLFAGCGNGGTQSSQEDSNSIVVGHSSDATTLDAQMYSDQITQSICLNIYEPVVRTNSDGEVLPGVAASWDISQDGMEYTFHLVEGMTFHNGDPVTADDVRFTIERCVDSPYVETYFAYVDTVETVDDATVKVTLSYPYSSFLSILSAYSGVVSENLLTDNPDAMVRNPVGSGPYKFVDWAQGNRINLVAFEDYHMGAAPIENLSFKVIDDRSTATVALEKGEVDVYVDISPQDRATVLNHENLELSETPSYIFRFLGINCEVEPFNDVRVRQAIAHAIDKEGIIIAAEEGVGEVAESHIPEGILGYDPDFLGLEYDVEKAKSLMAEAGYADGFTCDITTTETRSMYAQVIQANLKEIGIDTNIKLYEAGTFYEIIEGGDFDLHILGWAYICADPDVAVYDLYKSDAVMSGNYGRYANEYVDELLLRGRQSIDDAERQSIYAELEGIARDDAFNIPLLWSSSNIGYNKDLKGIEASPDKTYFIYDFSW